MATTHNLYKALCIGLLCMACQLGLSQADSSLAAAKPKFKEGYVASYWYNGVALATSPLRWKSDQWVTAGSSVLITGLVITMDDAISQPGFNWQTNTGSAVGKTGQIVGHPATQFGLSGVAIAAGAITHQKKLLHFGLDNLQAQVFTAAATVLVKELAHRARPITSNDKFDWSGPFRGGGDKQASFFSGHSSLAFSTATMVYLHSHKKWWVGVLSYGVATGVAVSRIQQQKHWASDVLMGAIVGTAISSFVYKQQEKRRSHLKLALKKLP